MCEAVGHTKHMTTQPTGILHRFTKLDAISGTVHVGTVSRRGMGFVTFCNGRTISFAVGTPAEVTCKSCIAKAERNGIDTKEL